MATVKVYAQDLRNLLEWADFIERKAFLRSFVKRIEINKNKAILRYKLPVPQEGNKGEEIAVLPIETLGGAGVSVGRTFDLEFSLTL